MKEVLLDSNIIIYSAATFKDEIEAYLSDKRVFASVISYIEVLGYHNLTELDKTYFQNFFDAINIVPVTTEIVEKSVELRQQKNIKLGDTIIAATALVDNKILVTRNVDDFDSINSLEVYNPF